MIQPVRGSAHSDHLTFTVNSLYRASCHSSFISEFLSVFVSLLLLPSPLCSPSPPLRPFYPSNPSPPRWGGLALAWLFHSLLISVPTPPPPPLLPDLHTSWTGTSRWLVFPLAFAQRAIPELSCHLEHIIRAPMTVKTGGICMCALNGTLEIIMTRSPRSLAHTHTYTQSSTFCHTKEWSQACCLSCCKLSLAHTRVYILSGD